MTGAVVATACIDRRPLPASFEFDGRTFDHFSSHWVMSGWLDVYAPKGDHPTTADQTVGVLRTRMSAGQTVQYLHEAEMQAARRTYATVTFDTFDTRRYQSCRVYVDNIGQPALALEIVEDPGDDRTTSTAVVWELDNHQQAARGHPLCREFQARLGDVWALHRRFVPVQ